jgi:hypothetical protein
MRSQSATCSAAPASGCGIGEHAAHLIGEIGRQRKLAAGIDRHRRPARRVGDEALGLADALEAQHLAGEQKGVARRQRLEKYPSSILPSTGPPRVATPRPART